MNRLAAVLCVIGGTTLLYPLETKGACLDADCYAFEYVDNSCIQVRWQQSSIPVHVVVNALGTPDIPFTSYFEGAFQAVAYALRTWSQVNSSYFLFSDDGIVSQSTTSGDDGINLIVWRNSSWPYDSSAIAVTTTWFNTSNGIISNADMELNDVNFTWKVVVPLVNCTPALDKNVVDVQNIVTHESGHMLGMGHPPSTTTCNGTTMYYSSGPCDTNKRTLSSSDITGYSLIYPTWLSIQSVTPNAADNNKETAMTIAVSGATSVLTNASLTLAHKPNITATVMTSTATVMTCTVPLTGVSVGSWTVWVTDANGNKGKLFDGFTVINGGTPFTPVSIAGVSNSVRTGTPVVLDGSLSYDPDGFSLTYSWSITGPENVTLSATNISTPSFTPHNTGNYIATLTVNNGTNSSQPSSVTITVLGAPSSSSGGNGCGCALQGMGQKDAILSGVFSWGLPFVYIVLRKRTSRRTPQPGRNPR